MLRISLVYGILAGAMIIGSAILSLNLTPGNTHMAALEWLGYLVMVIGLSAIFIGVKRYRDQQGGGVIRFWTAMTVGLGISVVAALIYVAAWEVNLSLTDHRFYADYTASQIAAKQESGATAEQMEAAIAEGEVMQARYANPFYRIPITFLEIFPVGLIISLISAAILRNSRILPAVRAAG